MKKSAARVAARTAGDKYYVPESPCRKGHMLRRVSTGSCIECARVAGNERVARDRSAYNARKRQERAHKLVELAEKARIARANESPEKRQARLEQAKLAQRLWRLANPAHAGTKKSKLKYKHRNQHKVRAGVSKRRAAKLLRTPVWLTADELWMIEQAHDLALLRTKQFGFMWHVDHVLPLQGKLVSGLHTPYNLQVIPATQNVAKANRFIPA